MKEAAIVPDNSAPTRYYVHGDRHQERADLYYCARCELFDFAQHFNDEAHVSTRVAWYERSIKCWRRLKTICRTKNRPVDTPNIIAEVVLSEARHERAARSPFFNWLVRQTKRDDPIGDLAADAIRDKAFPRAEKSADTVRAYLLDKRASPEALLAYDEARVEFSSKRKARTGLSLTQRFAIFKRDSYRCCLCGASAQEGIRLEVDHKVPIVRGGTNVEENLWTLCFECNRGKGVREL